MGASASASEKFVNISEFQLISSRRFGDKVIDAYADANGIISTKRMLELMAINYDIFISHDCDCDDSKINRIIRVCEGLKKYNIKPLFISDQHEKIINTATYSDFIKSSQIVGVFVTKNYENKVFKGDSSDGCHLQFYQAQIMKSSRKMIPIVVEECMRDAMQWEGPLGTSLRDEKLIDCSLDSSLDESIRELAEHIRSVILPLHEWSSVPLVDHKTEVEVVAQPRKRLSLLSPDEVGTLMEQLRVSNGHQVVREADINGEALSDVVRSADLHSMGLPLTDRTDAVYESLLAFKTEGVPLMLLERPKSLVSKEFPPALSNLRKQDSVRLQRPLEYLDDDVGRYLGDSDDCGAREGHGVYKFPNGDVYEGEWVDDKMHGPGVYTYTSTGNVYRGGHVCNQRHGAGTTTYANGDVFEGIYEEGAKSGFGKLQYASGDVYEGGFSKGLMHGLGVVKFSNGNVFKGNYVGGSVEGAGVMVYANGDVYEGEFKSADVRSGKGVLTLSSDDETYDGLWVDNRMHGLGKVTYANGDVWEGEWREGRKDGAGSLKRANGETSTDNWVAGVRTAN